MTVKIIVNDEMGTIWEVPSHSSNETYRCAVDENGELFCTCSDFIFRKAHKHPHLGDVNNYCKHLKEVLSNEDSSTQSNG